MNIEVSEDGGCSIAALRGDVDMSSSPRARRVILDCLGAGRHLLVDLSAVDYIDSSGVASLVEGFRLARDRELDFALLAVSEPARRVLQLARLDKVFPIYPSADDYRRAAG